MMRGAWILCVLGLAALHGCASQPSGWEQSAQARVEPVMQVTRIDDGVYEVRCELRTTEPGQGKVLLLGPRLTANEEQPARFSLSSNGFIRYLFEVTVSKADHPKKVRVTYLLLMATPRGIRPWQGRNVEWTLGETRGLPEESEPTASAPAPTK